MGQGGEHLSVINTFWKPRPKSGSFCPGKRSLSCLHLIIIRFLRVRSHSNMCISALYVISDRTVWNATNVEPRSIPGSRDLPSRRLCRQGGSSSEEMPIFTDPPLNHFNKLPFPSHTTVPVFFCRHFSCSPFPRSLSSLRSLPTTTLFQTHLLTPKEERELWG